MDIESFWLLLGHDSMNVGRCLSESFIQSAWLNLRMTSRLERGHGRILDCNTKYPAKAVENETSSQQ